MILFGSGQNVAYRMSFLLPKPYGNGTRKNAEKRKYLMDHMSTIEYRTYACPNIQEAKGVEKRLKSSGAYKFMT